MISDESLLQANTTVIAGILIFLTISPMSRGMTNQNKREKINFVFDIFYISVSYYLNNRVIN